MFCFADLQQEYYYLAALDVYRKIPYSKGKEERNGWIGLLATENVEEAERLVEEYPWLEEIYGGRGIHEKAGGGAWDVFRGVTDIGSEYGALYDQGATGAVGCTV